jgi:hypothetical protein
LTISFRREQLKQIEKEKQMAFWLVETQPKYFKHCYDTHPKNKTENAANI